eukprot:1325342-Amorphochlora_amoeboformis.AAC.2
MGFLLGGSEGCRGGEESAACGCEAIHMCQVYVSLHDADFRANFTAGIYILSRLRAFHREVCAYGFNAEMLQACRDKNIEKNRDDEKVREFRNKDEGPNR